MNAQRFVANLPGYLIIVLLALAGCATIQATTIEINPISVATVSLPPTTTPTSTPNTIPTQIPPSTTPFPTPPTTSTPFPQATPAASPISNHLSDPPVERRLLVNQDEQLMVVYENDIAIRTIPVSTGAPVTNRFTPPWQGTVGDDWGNGPFQNRQLADYKWFLFAGPEGSILLHSVPYTITNSGKVYDGLEALGVEPVSNGCVRISPEDAAWLKNWDPVGVPITITRWPPGKIQPADAVAQEVIAEESKNE